MVSITSSSYHPAIEKVWSSGDDRGERCWMSEGAWGNRHFTRWRHYSSHPQMIRFCSDWARAHVLLRCIRRRPEAHALLRFTACLFPCHESLLVYVALLSSNISGCLWSSPIWSRKIRMVVPVRMRLLINWQHEFHETCHSATFIVLVNSHQRWKQTRVRVCFHLWCELTLALWCPSIVWSLFFIK